MSDDPRDDTIDTGDPVTELAELATAPSGGFLGRVRNRIERRQVGSHLLSLSWHGTAAVFFEFLSLFFAPFESSDDKGGPS